MDLWSEIRSFCGATEKPDRERWLQLKNLSHRIGLEENPDPMWDHLKTQIVREVFLNRGSCFCYGGLSLELYSQCSSRGLRWGRTSADKVSEIWKEERWLQFGFEEPRGPELLRGFKGWDNPAEVSRNQVLEGIPWSVNLTVRCSERSDLRFYLPLDVGFLCDPEGELESKWLHMLKCEDDLIRNYRTEAEISEDIARIERDLAGTDREWLRVVTAELLLHIQAVSGRFREFEPAHNLMFAYRDYHDRLRWGSDLQYKVYAEVMRKQYPDCEFWRAGPARSMLCEHALQTFVAKDQRGRSVVSSENIRIALAP